MVNKDITSAVECATAIEEAINNNFDGLYLAHAAAKEVIQTYGLDLVKLVLANTVMMEDWDMRYSRKNKEWAKSFPNPFPETVRAGFLVTSHPAVTNGFIDLVLEEAVND